ncbi:MAG: PIN domain-containing protein [Candidatus Bathyarchaeota archaeon]|jgi:predicted nucleic acid-binding protein|nr:PIN domain-containing protein [Candidatus Bathyarchaeota archaeon]
MIVGLDTNIICYALDEDYPENKLLNDLLLNLSPDNKAAINPTVIHEAYHVLVFAEKWHREEAAHAIKLLLRNPYIEFYNQTRKTSTIALDLSIQYNLGGRDALIIANCLSNKTPTLYTHDKTLLKHQKITYKNTTLTIKDPLNKT